MTYNRHPSCKGAYRPAKAITFTPISRVDEYPAEEMKMKWHPPSERTQMFLLSPIVVPIALCILPLVPFFWLTQKVSEWLLPQRDWHRWFAWRPVRIFDWDAFQAEWFWLETIERRRHWSGGDCSYRALSAHQSLPLRGEG